MSFRDLFQVMKVLSHVLQSSHMAHNITLIELNWTNVYGFVNEKKKKKKTHRFEILQVSSDNSAFIIMIVWCGVKEGVIEEDTLNWHKMTIAIS